MHARSTRKGMSVPMVVWAYLSARCFHSHAHGPVAAIPVLAIAICIDEVFISPLWVIVFLLRFALPPFLVPCRAGMHARSTRRGMSVSMVVWACLSARCLHWHAHGQGCRDTGGSFCDLHR